MKKTFYITCFTFLGFLLQQLLHSIIEIWYIGLLTQDFIRYGFGLSWSSWYLVHYAGTFILLIGGLAFGFFQGKRWWTRLYDEQGHRKPWQKT